MDLFLADSSIWIGARRNPDTYLSRLFVERLSGDELATCVPIALEVLTGPRSGRELEQEWDDLWSHLRWLPVTEAAVQRSLALLRGLASTTDGAHRRRPIDYLVAACAEAAEGAVLWHWDRDLTAICDYAGIRHEPEHPRARENGLA